MVPRTLASSFLLAVHVPTDVPVNYTIHLVPHRLNLLVSSTLLLFAGLSLPCLGSCVGWWTPTPVALAQRSSVRSSALSFQPFLATVCLQVIHVCVVHAMKGFFLCPGFLLIKGLSRGLFSRLISMTSFLLCSWIMGVSSWSLVLVILPVSLWSPSVWQYIIWALEFHHQSRWAENSSIPRYSLET